jgi:hypothetical protein
VALDLEGYTTGSLNRTLKTDAPQETGTQQARKQQEGADNG